MQPYLQVGGITTAILFPDQTSQDVGSMLRCSVIRLIKIARGYAEKRDGCFFSCTIHWILNDSPFRFD